VLNREKELITELATLGNSVSVNEDMLALPDSGLSVQLSFLLAGVAEKEVEFRTFQSALAEISFREEGLTAEWALVGDVLSEREDQIEELLSEVDSSRKHFSDELRSFSAEAAALRDSLEDALILKAKTEEELAASSEFLSMVQLEVRSLNDSLSALRAQSAAAAEEADRTARSNSKREESLSQELEVVRTSLESSEKNVKGLEIVLEKERRVQGFSSEVLRGDLRALKEAHEAALTNSAAALEDRQKTVDELERRYADAFAARADTVLKLETRDAALAAAVAEAKRERDLWSAALQEKCEDAARREVELTERESNLRASCTEAGKVAALSVQRTVAMEAKVNDLQELTAALRRENAEAARRDAAALAAVAAEADALAAALDTARLQRDAARAQAEGALQVHRFNLSGFEVDRSLAMFEVAAFRAGGALSACSSSEGGLGRASPSPSGAEGVLERPPLRKRSSSPGALSH
jgi:myosin heavy subunit